MRAIVFDANCQQEEDEEVGSNQPSMKRRKPPRSAWEILSRKRQPDRLRKVNHASLSTPVVARGRATRLCRRKKRRLSMSVSPDHRSSQDVDPLPNTYAVPPTVAPDTDTGLPIVGTLDVSTVGAHAVYALHFRLNDVGWPSKPSTADPNPAIEDELEWNGQCKVEKIVGRD